MELNGGEIAILVLLLSGLLISAYEHGKPKKGKVNFWNSLISAIFWFVILRWAGLF